MPRHPGHHRQEPFQDGTDPDNRCHTDARSRHFGKRQGGKINAVGTPDKPIVMTSEKEEPP